MSGKIYNYFKKTAPDATPMDSPVAEERRLSSDDGSDIEELVNNNKRKRSEDDEDDNSGKRRSEEPLVRIIKPPFVDETTLEDFSDIKQKNKNSDQSEEVIDVSDTDEDGKKEVDEKKEVDDENDDSDDGEEAAWEVEEIIDYQYCKESEQGLYQVKWVGWDSGSNTWEPEAHLECHDLLANFYKTRLKEREGATPAEKRALELPPDPRETFQIRQDFLKQFCPPTSKKELERLFIKDKLLPPSKRVKILPEKMLNAAVDSLAKSNKPNEKRLEWVRAQLRNRDMFNARSDQLEDLKKYETEINQIDPHAHVSIINDADLEGPPRQMQYINAYKASEGIHIPDDPFIGCECEGGCDLKNEKNCCSGSSGFKLAYTKHAKLRIEVGCPIYECNKRCQCGPDCVNRVVQKGRKHKLQIFRTDNGCGWGVKSLENIKAGSFVVEYVGEVISNEEAERRGKKYDAEGRTYLFDLDFNLGDENLYTVDAAFYGNCSHFINHSCDPNLSIFNVYINNLDPNMPQLCLFARRDIKKGEQISFDYCQSTGASSEGEAVPATPSKRAQGDLEAGDEGRPECRCGSSNCRKVLF